MSFSRQQEFDNKLNQLKQFEIDWVGDKGDQTFFNTQSWSLEWAQYHSGVHIVWLSMLGAMIRQADEFSKRADLDNQKKYETFKVYAANYKNQVIPRIKEMQESLQEIANAERALRAVQARNNTLDFSYRRDFPNVLSHRPEMSAETKASLVDYVNNNVKPILAAERARLSQKYQDGEDGGRIGILDLLAKQIDNQIDRFNKGEILADRLQTNITLDITTQLNTNNLDQYKSWEAELGLALLNTLMLFTIIPFVVKYAATGTCFFSLKGKSYEAASEAYESTQGMGRLIHSY